MKMNRLTKNKLIFKNLMKKEMSTSTREKRVNKISWTHSYLIVKRSMILSSKFKSKKKLNFKNLRTRMILMNKWKSLKMLS